jgi:hypothetical protein
MNTRITNTKELEEAVRRVPLQLENLAGILDIATRNLDQLSVSVTKTNVPESSSKIEVYQGR